MEKPILDVNHLSIFWRFIGTHTLVGLLLTNTKVQGNLFIAGQYTTQGYGTITDAKTKEKGDKETLFKGIYSALFCIILFHFCIKIF